MKNTFSLNAKDKEFYGKEKITLEYTGKMPVLPNIRENLKQAFPENLENYTDLILTHDCDIVFLRNLLKSNGIYLSIHNSKVARGAAAAGYNSPVSFGKTGHATCLYASEVCLRTCYQNLNWYPNSKNAHFYNALIFANFTFDEILQGVQLTIDTLNPDVIRLLDNGDNSLPAEIKLWDRIAKNNPQIRIYGYTKAAELIHMTKIKSENAENFVVWNLSDNGDDNSKKWTEKLYNEGFKKCHINYTCNFDENIPFNNEESLAMLTPSEMEKKYNTRVFQIGYHGQDSEFKNSNKFFKNLEYKLTVKVC